jgi:hypothetical protein
MAGSLRDANINGRRFDAGWNDSLEVYVGPCDRERFLCGRQTERGVHGTGRGIEVHVMTKRDVCAGSYGRERCMHCENK